MEATHIAVAPGSAPDWVRETVAEAGGTLVEPADASGLIWFSGSAAGLDELMRQAPGLRWVQLATAGVESFAGLLDSSRLWTCAKSIYGDAVAEHALALVLAAFRQIGHYARLAEWGAPAGRNLHGARVTIVGGGGIAQSLVRLLEPFGAEVTIVRRQPVPMPGVRRVLGVGELRSALGDADVVVLALALTEETAGLIGRSELEVMKRDAWLVNVARGRHVDTAALTEAIVHGGIGGAALDVTDPEPLPKDHPLWSADNCIITPHTANTVAMMRGTLATLLRFNVAAHIAGEPLRGIADPVLAY